MELIELVDIYNRPDELDKAKESDQDNPEPTELVYDQDEVT